ncbi:hypothetical protein OG585_51000 (plasmid) [Streptomyces sp. NBC_01340]|nr:hypothetical protein OG585_51000 [Streptomyces sp. NBC_01340]
MTKDIEAPPPARRPARSSATAGLTLSAFAMYAVVVAVVPRLLERG